MPSQHWSREENNRLVSGAFRLRARGGANKADERRRLAPLLGGRTEKAIEFKLGNASCIMRELGIGGIPGYVGFDHYQASLRDEVRRQATALGLLTPGVPRGA